MVQVLQYVPSFLETLQPAINQAAQGAGQMYGMSQLNKKIQQNEKILADPNSSAVQKAGAYSAQPDSWKESSGTVWAAALGPQAEIEAYNQYKNQQPNGQTQDQNPATQVPTEFEGYKFSPEEQALLIPKPPTPAVGPLAAEAKIENTNRNRAEDQTNKFLEKIPDIAEMDTGLHKLNEAKKILESLPDDIMRQLIQAKLQDKDLGALEEVFKGPKLQKLFNLLRPYLKSKELGGSNPSNREFLAAASSLPSGLKTKEANLYIIDEMIKDQQKQLKLRSFYNYATSKNPYISPQNLQNIGRKITSPAPLEKVPPGTELSDENAAQLVIQFGDVERAKKAARDAGYDIP